MVNVATGDWNARSTMTRPVRNDVVRSPLHDRPLADSAQMACTYQTPITSTAARVTSAKGLVSHDVSTLWRVNARRWAPGMPVTTGSRSRLARQAAYRP